MTITLEVGRITIRYLGGRVTEGFVLARHGNRMRVAVKDGEDAVEFTSSNGIWISEECEPVEIQFEWHRHAPRAPVSEADCICPKELAARLIHVLLSGDEEECSVPAPLERPRRRAMLHGVS